MGVYFICLINLFHLLNTGSKWIVHCRHIYTSYINNIYNGYIIFTHVWHHKPLLIYYSFNSSCLFSYIFSERLSFHKVKRQSFWEELLESLFIVERRFIEWEFLLCVWGVKKVYRMRIPTVCVGGNMRMRIPTVGGGGVIWVL